MSKITEKINYFKNLIGRDVTIFQMGKVGSRTIYDTLINEYDYEPTYFHVMDNGEFYHANMNDKYHKYLPKTHKNVFHKWYHILNRVYIRSTYKNKTLKKKHKVITIVREPISRNLSYFFQDFKFYLYIYEKLESNVEEVSFEELFRYCYHKIQNQDFPLDYFDTQFKPIYDIDIYDYEFDKEKGYSVFTKDDLEVLVIRLDKLNGLSKEIGEFLNVDDYELKNYNVGNHKWYKHLYDEVKTYNYDEEYLNQMYDHKFTKFFFTDEEIENFRSKYSI